MNASVSEALAALRAGREAALSRSLSATFDADPQRFAKFHARLDDLLFDYSKQRVFEDTLAQLLALAAAADVEAKRDAMFRGDLINSTERRAALHTALRDLTGAPVMVDGHDFAPDIVAERERMLAFAADVREGRSRGSLGQPFTDVVNIGIGGSDLGPAMAARALSPFGQPQLRCHFVSNVDGADPLGHVEGARRGAHAVHRFVEDVHHAGDDDQRPVGAAMAGGGAGRKRGRRPFRRRLDQPRKGARVRNRRRICVRLLGLGRRPLLGVVEHRLARRHRRRAGEFPGIPGRRPRRRRALPLGPLEGQHPRVDGAAVGVEPQRAGPRHPGGHPLRPTARALSRLSPAIADGEQRQGRAARRRPRRRSHRRRRLGRARHQRPARVFPVDPPGHGDRAGRFPHRRAANPGRQVASRVAGRQLPRPGRSADARPHGGGGQGRCCWRKASRRTRPSASARTNDSPAAGRPRRCSIAS